MSEGAPAVAWICPADPTMLALLPLALGYVTIPPAPESSFILRWTMPANSADDSGLGGGLTFATERFFC